MVDSNTSNEVKPIRLLTQSLLRELRMYSPMIYP